MPLVLKIRLCILGSGVLLVLSTITLICFEPVDHIWDRVIALHIALLSLHVTSFLYIAAGFVVACRAEIGMGRLLLWSAIVSSFNFIVAVSSLCLNIRGRVDFTASLWVSEEAKVKTISNET